MASAAQSGIEEVVVCGYCLEPVERVEQPKRLLCSHVFCSPCLIQYLEETKVLKCGKCRTAYDTAVADLPDVNCDSILCKPCLRRGNRENAEVYCRSCDSQFCAKHRQSHDDTLEHSTMDIVEYRKQVRKLETRFCVNHPSQPLSLTCLICKAVLCMKCLDMKSKCLEGRRHQPVSLSALVDEITKENEELNVKALQREQELSDLIKICSQTSSQLEEETKEMIEKLHHTRDEQIKAIKLKYVEIEAELVKQRQKSVETVIEFMNSVVRVKWTEVNAETQRNVAWLRDSHQVDLVKRFEEMKETLKGFTEEELPYLLVRDQVKLETSKISRCPELEITHSTDMRISDIQNTSSKPKMIPGSLVKSYQVTGLKNMASVFVFDGRISGISCGGDVFVIDPDSSSLEVKHKIQSVSDIDGAAVDNGKLYIINFRSRKPWSVRVLNAERNEILRWDHKDTSEERIQLACVGGQVVVPNVSAKKLVVYSLKGEKVKGISIPRLSAAPTYICSVGTDFVIVCDSKQVCRVNIITDKIIWTSAALCSPQGVACYGDKVMSSDAGTSDWFVFVSCGKKISVLDGNTGNHLKDLPGDSEDGIGSIISIYEDTLLHCTTGGTSVTAHTINP